MELSPSRASTCWYIWNFTRYIYPCSMGEENQTWLLKATTSHLEKSVSKQKTLKPPEKRKPSLRFQISLYFIFFVSACFVTTYRNESTADRVVSELTRAEALFWSCFGGVEMLRDFGLAEHLRSESGMRKRVGFIQKPKGTIWYIYIIYKPLGLLGISWKNRIGLVGFCKILCSRTSFLSMQNV